jgi:thioredoxin 1
VVEITDESFARDVLEADGPVVVDFWAPWCGPCKGVEKVLGELEAEHGERISFVKMNIDDHPERASELGVLSLPTVIVFEAGEQQTTVVGVRPRAFFEEKLAQWLGAA